MKKYDEMVNSLFERRDQYENEKKQRKIKFTKTLTPICCVCLVALLSIGVWQGDWFNNEPPKTSEDAVIPGTKDWYGPGEDEPDISKKPTDTGINENTESDITDDFFELYPDLVGMVLYNGNWYLQHDIIQEGSTQSSKYIKGEKIGNGSDFDGTYNAEWVKKANEDKGIGYIYSSIPKSEIYTVKDNPDYLYVVLENGAEIILYISK